MISQPLCTLVADSPPSAQLEYNSITNIQKGGKFMIEDAIISFLPNAPPNSHHQQGEGLLPLLRDFFQSQQPPVKQGRSADIRSGIKWKLKFCQAETPNTSCEWAISKEVVSGFEANSAEGANRVMGPFSPCKVVSRKTLSLHNQPSKHLYFWGILICQMMFKKGELTLP